MPKKSDVDQISSTDRVDSLRRELDAKIEKKVTYQVFIFIILLLTGVCTYGFKLISDLSNKYEDLSKCVTILQTQHNDKK